MNNKTIFSIIPDNVEAQLIKVGFNYQDKTYINAFRWLWNEQHIHPSIISFIGDPQNKSRVTVRSLYRDNDNVYYCGSYDEAVIWVVEYISRNIPEFFINC